MFDLLFSRQNRGSTEISSLVAGHRLVFIAGRSLANFLIGSFKKLLPREEFRQLVPKTTVLQYTKMRLVI